MKYAALLLAAMMLAACAGEVDGEGLYLDDSQTTEDFSVESQELIGGTVTSDRPEIGRLYFGGSSCTATLISPRALVTAKHCVNYTSCSTAGCGSRYRASVQFTTQTGAQRFFNVDRFVSFDRRGELVPDGAFSDIQYTDTRRSDFYLNDDVALLLLEQAVPASVATPSGLAADEPGSGEALSVWGYGCTRRGGGTDGNKRYKDFAVGSSANALCPGDSGGPVTEGRQGSVAFVNSAYLQTFRGSLDIYGDVTRILPEVEAQLSAWGESGSSGPANQAPQPPTSSPLLFEATSSFGIPDRSSLALNLTVNDDRVVDGIQVDFTFDHPRPTDLAFVLRAPDGSGIVLQRAGRDGSLTRSFTVDAFDGRSAAGTWTIQIYDLYSGAVGDVTDLAITYF